MRGRRHWYSTTFLAICGLGTCPSLVEAHGFGQRYDLPIPLSFYVFGAGATVLISFMVIVVALPIPLSAAPYPTVAVPSLVANGISIRRIASATGAVSAIYFILIVVAGLFGAQSPTNNIIVVSIWVIGWVAISLCCAFVYNIWSVVDPWWAISEFVRWIFGVIGPRQWPLLGWKYPAAVGAWPALVLFLLFAWLELVWTGRDVPARLAQVVLIYSAFTWAGMLAFGRQSWRANADMFAIVFGIFARFAPLVRDSVTNRFLLRPPGCGLLDDVKITPPILALIVALLSTVTFDGMLETPLWAHVDIAVINAPDDSILWTVFSLSEGAAVRLVRSIGLLATTAGFGSIYLAVCWMIAIFTKRAGGGVQILAPRFVMSLLPISIAYHVAHYFTYLFNSCQLVIPLLSDPLGLGWNLFGTAALKPDIGLVTPGMQWYVAITAIVSGHMLAVYIAHVKALQLFRERRLATISQIPMLVLMVGYTMLSLWILSQPIVETVSAGR